MTWVLCVGGTAVAFLAAVFVLLLVAGLLLPRDHVASRTARFAAAPGAVWAVVSDFEAGPSWNPSVKKVERLPDREGRPAWREDLAFGPPLAFVLTESVPPRRQVRTIDAAQASFGGSWTWELEPDGTGTRLTLTERGTVPFPLWRTLVRIMGADAHVVRYLRALAARLGEAPRIDAVR